MKLPYLNLSGMNRLPLIHQSTSAECGLACLAMISNYFGNRIDLIELRRKHSLSIRGMKLKTLVDLAIELELGSRVLRCGLEELAALRTPCILHWGFNHFVVLKKVTSKWIEIHDPSVGFRRVLLEEVSREFTGIAIELTPTENFKKKSAPSELKLFDLVKFDRQLFGSFSLGLLLCLIVEILLLASPFYMQVVIDEVLMKGDKLLLDAIAIGFGFVVLFSVVSNILRKLTFQFIGQVLSFDMSSRVFQKLLSLPVNYFSNRQTGDVQHRVSSLNQVQYFLTTGAPALLMDSVFSILILTIMFFYHSSLTFGVLLAVAVYCFWRWLVFGMMKRVAGDLIISEAAVETDLLETLRSMPTLKLSAMEAQREAKWRNLQANKINANLRVGNLDIANQGVNEGIFQGLRVVIIFVAAKLVLENGLSIGMLTAYLAYYTRFSQRIVALIEEIVRFKLLSVPLNRISDIVYNKPEDAGLNGLRNSSLKGKLDLRGIAFTYGAKEAPVLRRIQLSVAAGEFVAIVGPSGTGKSTLLKIIAGIESTNTGQVLFDERPVSHWNRNELRRQIGVVLQEDSLFRGTIAENIALFSEEIDMEHVKFVCYQCAIAVEIESMPMSYESLIGDVGTSLSGGQKQRILLARALYKKPKVLLLDEATSHLDYQNEQIIASTLSKLGITRVVVAHRQETIESADRVLILKDGVLVNKSIERLKQQSLKNTSHSSDAGHNLIAKY
ncbi:MAG TPA: peptidase domain-containing ABC transporter [Pseudoalteromonas prydzensis]|uniref:Peptidase domain-containing ABC transporter n=2 Tax=root TaxID=1 RepID=A0A7V1D3G5_9GAMM|nr:peptidase domain-containing ABC transporter [Pseudoalteromonas prydzensis]HEA19211.1 peptidase domain-containing ABC transporter [Pseudoalteromonas prydzensis]